MRLQSKGLGRLSCHDYTHHPNLCQEKGESVWGRFLICGGLSIRPPPPARDYNTLIMFHGRGFLCVSACLLAAAGLVPMSRAQNQAQSQRALNHGDYDSWRSIVGQKLSADGTFLVYGLFPQEGDGEVVIRNLATGKEQREPAGQRPAPVPPAPDQEGPPPEARGATITFSADSKTVVLSTFPPKAESDKARKDKKPAPKEGMVIVDLGSGKTTRVERVKGFAMPEKASGLLVYLREAPDPPAGGAGTAPATAPMGDGDEIVAWKRNWQAKAPAPPAQASDVQLVAQALPPANSNATERSAWPAAAPKPEGDQQGGRGGAAAGAAGAGGRGPRPEFGSDLVVRNLADASERTIADVVEFTLTEDGKQLVYTVSAHDSAKNGVFALKPGSGDAPAALAEGKGKYVKLTWDENQTQVVFLSDRDDAAAKPPKWKLYRWERQAPSASVVASAGMPGFRQEFVISDQGTLSFSKDGTRVFFACAKPAPPAPDKKDEATDAPADDTKAVVDLWSYKDDYIQPIQKVRAERDRNRTFTAAYLIPEHRIVQLADSAVETVTPSESSRWLMGTDDRQYRPLADYDEHYADTYVIDASTGARTLLATKQHSGIGGGMTWSPAGHYLLYFDGKDWNTVSVPEGRKANLTATLGVKFFNEDTDTPGTPAAYGNAGWTKDGKSLLIYDRYDIWNVSPDGTSARNITAGYGRAHDLRLRYVRTALSGGGGEPKLLVMSPKYMMAPVKAKDAEVYLLTVQSFSEFPDLVTTDGSFHELRKVSDANPQKANLLWGTSEVVHFHNADGVPLTGALYKPANFDPKKKYPMLVYIYERLTQNVNHFVDPRPSHNINFSYYTSNGYLVFTPDIVYTTGFPGQSALKCVLPGVQAIVDKGFVKEDAIGIQGHSWGGYQIAYMVTQTNRFRAVAAGNDWSGSP